MPPPPEGDVAPTLAIVASIELSRRGAPGGDWAGQTWGALAPALAGALTTRPGPAGTIVVAWPLGRPEDLAAVADTALSIRGRVARRAGSETQLRGGIAIGVVGATAGPGAAERVAERLALAASPDQWLVVPEAARLLRRRFELRPAGRAPRWPMPLRPDARALSARLEAPVLPSAVTGDPPGLLVGRTAERERLLGELTTAAAGGRRVVLVTAPAGGGKSYVLRHVLADPELSLELAAGVAFPPLGGGMLDPLRALLAGCGAAADGADTPEQLGRRLGVVASARARARPAALVVDDVHWADPDALVALRAAIVATEPDVPLAWMLSARTAALPKLAGLTELADAEIALAPLHPAERIQLLEQNLNTVPDVLRTHVTTGRERGNPLYLDHLADLLSEAGEVAALPGTLHEAVLARLERLIERARQLTHWTQRSLDPQRELRALERELGDWLDRLETTDLAELATIGRYLARLRRVDLELVIAHSLLGVPVATNRRLGDAIERLAAASTGALLDYLTAVAQDGRPGQAAHEAFTSAYHAERALRLADAERLIAFACEHDPGRPDLLRKRGDLALAMGRAEPAIAAYAAATRSSDRPGAAEIERRAARAEAAGGHPEEASRRLQRTAQLRDLDPGTADALALDLARLHGVEPAGPEPQAAAVRRRFARVGAWAHAGETAPARRAAGLLVLEDAPAACAAELVETAALARLAGVEIAGLTPAARTAAVALGNPLAHALLEACDPGEARRMFLHWDT